MCCLSEFVSVRLPVVFHAAGVFLWDYSRFKSARSGKLVFFRRTDEAIRLECQEMSDRFVSPGFRNQQTRLRGFQNGSSYTLFTMLAILLIFDRVFSSSRNTSLLSTEMTPLNCLLERDSAHPYRLTGDPSHCKDIKNVWYSWLNNCTVPGGAPWGRAFVHQLTEKRADRQHGCFWTLTMWAAWLTVRPETSNDPSDSSSQWCVKSQQDDVSYAVSVPHAAFANICQFKPLKWGYLLLFSVYIS